MNQHVAMVVTSFSNHSLGLCRKQALTLFRDLMIDITPVTNRGMNNVHSFMIAPTGSMDNPTFDRAITELRQQFIAWLDSHPEWATYAVAHWPNQASSPETQAPNQKLVPFDQLYPQNQDKARRILKLIESFLEDAEPDSLALELDEPLDALVEFDEQDYYELARAVETEFAVDFNCAYGLEAVVSTTRQLRADFKFISVRDILRKVNKAHYLLRKQRRCETPRRAKPRRNPYV